MDVTGIESSVCDGVFDRNDKNMTRRNYVRIDSHALFRFGLFDEHPHRRRAVIRRRLSETARVRWLIGFRTPAARSISVARIMSQWLSDHLGQQFIVENRTGSGGNIAAAASYQFAAGRPTRCCRRTEQRRSAPRSNKEIALRFHSATPCRSRASCS